MARPSKKTPIELAREMQEKATRAAARAARYEVGQNPILAPFNDGVENAQKAITMLSRKLEGANSFKNRIESQRLRGIWIEAEQAYTIALDAQERAVKAYLQDQSDAFTQRLADGENITAEDVSYAILGIPIDPHVKGLSQAMESAETEWRNFGRSLKGESLESPQPEPTANAAANAATS